MTDPAATPEPVTPNPLDPQEPVSNITEAADEAEDAVPGDSSVPADPTNGSTLPTSGAGPSPEAGGPTGPAPTDPSLTPGQSPSTPPPADQPNPLDPTEPVSNITTGPESPAPATGTGDAVAVTTPVVADPAAAAQAAIDQAAAHPTNTNAGAPPPLAGAPMSDETRAWIEANGSHVWVVTDPG